MAKHAWLPHELVFIHVVNDFDIFKHNVGLHLRFTVHRFTLHCGQHRIYYRLRGCSRGYRLGQIWRRHLHLHINVVLRRGQQMRQNLAYRDIRLFLFCILVFCPSCVILLGCLSMLLRLRSRIWTTIRLRTNIFLRGLVHMLCWKNSIFGIFIVQTREFVIGN